MRRIVGPLLLAFLLSLDQATKALVLRTIHPADPIEVTSFFNLVLVWNRGVSFGMFAQDGIVGRWGLIAVALAITLFLVVWLIRERRFIAQLAIWAIIAGSLGNVIDRLRFGAVVDFLDFHLWGQHWPAFNVADSAIVVGAAILVIDSLTAKPGAKKDEKTCT